MSSAREPKVFLWDAQDAARTALRFASGKSFDEFLSDDLLRSGIERQLQIVGEALNQLSKVEPRIAERLPRLRQIIAFRNILVHGYASLDYENVWRIVHNDLPPLVNAIGVILDADIGPEEA